MESNEYTYIKTIQELKQYIGKPILLSRNNQTCDVNSVSTIFKVITKIEYIDSKELKEYPNQNSLYPYKIWGKLTACNKGTFFYIPDFETYSTRIEYARIPTEKETKFFRQMWRKIMFKNMITPK